MSATVFAYVVLFTLLVAGGAAALEWGMQGRIPTRHFWTAAIALALLAPPAVLDVHAFVQRGSGPDSAPVLTGTALKTIVVTSGAAGAHRIGGLVSRDAPIRFLIPGRRAAIAAIAALSRLNRRFMSLAIALWALSSLALVAWIIAGTLRWRHIQRAWRRTTLDGVDIDISASTGPAVLGLLSHRIVLPSWATMMQPEHRRLVLAHECEHISARDPERLALAVAALVLMPWNVGLWWCAARLRRAVELDCDARVLRRFPSAREYGYVLLEVAARGRNTGPLAIPMVALLRLPSELELRLRAMTRVRSAGLHGAVFGGIVGPIAVAAAFIAPVPSVQAGYARTLTRATHAAAFDVLGHGDTVATPRVDTAALLRRRSDSLRVVARELAARDSELSAVRARLDSDNAMLYAHHRDLTAREFRPWRAKLPINQKQTYFEFQVDTPAVVLPGAAPPVYPDSLLRAGISGQVDAQFVVDTAGRVEMPTLKLLKSTNAQFSAAVRVALARMRFAPAIARRKRVRQLVSQPFMFTISGPER